MTVPVTPAVTHAAPVGEPRPRTSIGTPATRAGQCECCATPYRAGTPIIWDRAVAGWVLIAHRSAASRRAPQPGGNTPL